MPLTAGAAVRDISPKTGVALYGYPHVERIATGIHDPLLASALTLDNGDTRLVLVALDILFLAPPAARDMRRRVARQLDIEERQVFISCSHTHSGPVTAGLLSWSKDASIPPPDAGYLAMVADQVVAAAEEAAAAAGDAELAWTAADATGVGGNRLSNDGATDTECGVLAVRARGDHRLLATSLIYGMHPTVLHEDSSLVSSDFPHYTRLHLQEQIGDGCIVLYHNAPCGNQSPRRFVDGQTFAEAERLGRKLGQATVDALNTIDTTAWISTPRLDALLEPIELPRRSLPSIAEAEAELSKVRAQYATLQAQKAPRTEVRTAECSVFGAEGSLTLATLESQGRIADVLSEYTPIEVQALRIGNACLAGLPGECFTEYALSMKAQSPARTFVASFVNGELQGYIVTPEAAALGGYEATNAVFGPEAGEIMVNSITKLVARLNAGAQ